MLPLRVSPLEERDIYDALDMLSVIEPQAGVPEIGPAEVAG